MMTCTALDLYRVVCHICGQEAVAVYEEWAEGPVTHRAAHKLLGCPHVVEITLE